MGLNVGLDIGTSAVRAALVQTGKGQAVLKKVGQVPLPDSAVVGGEIVDEGVVRDAITKLWKQAKLPRKNIVVGIANQRVIVRRVDLPYMPESELAEALPFQAQEYIPIPVEEAIMDFVPLEEFTTPEGQPMMSVLVVAAHRDMAAHVLKVVGSANLKVMAVDLSPLAMVRAIFGSDFSLSEGAEAVVNIGAGLTQVILVEAGTVKFLRILSVGGRDFTRTLVERAGLDEATAEQLKRRVGVAVEGVPTGTEGEDLVRALLTKQADVLIDDVRGSVQYFLGQTESGSLDRMLVAGNGARLPHLANRLGQALNVSVEPIKPLEGGSIEVGKIGLSDAELAQLQPVLPVPIGLALWGEV